MTKVEKKKPEKVLREGGQFIESLFNRISSISKKRLEVLFGSIPLTSCKEKEVEGKKRCRTLILGHFKKVIERTRINRKIDGKSVKYFRLWYLHF